MGDVAKAGRTVVLVSHQMNQIGRLCERAVWMDNGTMRRDGATSGQCWLLMRTAMWEAKRRRKARRNGTRRKSQGAQFLRWSIEGEARRAAAHSEDDRESFVWRFEVEVRRSIRNGEHGIALYTTPSGS
jgi:ABC-type multidrug transport system ATPase subunit